MHRDTYKHKGQRKRLAELLSEEGITDKNVLSAIEKVPRHFFFPSDFESRAYENIAFPIQEGQTISQPYTVAFQTALLGIKSGDKILEVGTGSGYQAAILAAMGGHVFSIETIPSLHEQAKELIDSLALNVNLFVGDGSQGLRKFAPFDKIIITAAAPSITKTIAEQLKINGKLVAPVGNKDVQKMILIERIGENEFKKSTHGKFTFVPLTGKHGWQH